MHYDIWRMDALNKLQEHKARKISVMNIQKRIEGLERDIVAIRSSTSDGTPVKGGGSGREDMLLNNIVMRQRLQESLTRTQDAVDRTEQALSALTEDDRRILECFYISPRKGAATQLAGELGIAEKTVYNRRNNAIRLFQMAMFGDIL